MRLGVLGEGADGGVRARPQRNEGDDLLAEPCVRPAHHAGLGHRRMGHQDVFDIARVHVEAAAEDQVFLPVHHVQVSAGVQMADVAGVQPAVGEDRRRGVLGVPVAGHHARRPHADLAVLARRQ